MTEPLRILKLWVDVRAVLKILIAPGVVFIDWSLVVELSALLDNSSVGLLLIRTFTSQFL